MYITIQSFAIKINIEFRCTLYLLTIPEMIPQFSEFSWLDMFWKGTYPCLFKVPKVNVSECEHKCCVKAKNHEMQLSQVGTNLRKGTEQFLLLWRYNWARWPHIICKKDKFRTTRTIPRPGRPSKLGYWGEGLYSGEWPRTQCVLFQNFAEERPPLQACMGELPDGGFSHGSLPGVCQKAPEGLWPWGTKFSGIILQKLNDLVWMPGVMFGGYQALLSANGWNFFTLSIFGIVCRIDFILE